MARRKKGRQLDGVLLLHKDAGMSSNMALQKTKRLFDAQKAGHAGTLDPFAEGLLPILLGQASKFGHYLLSDDKRYRATALFGSETDTDDKDGQITRETTIPDLKNVDWTSLLASFVGVQQQIPPAYSALKINGQRAYALARQGKAPELAAREIVVHSFELVELTDTTATFDIHCAKGTYIRALIRDLARAIDSSAHTVALSRTQVGHLSPPYYRLGELERLPIEALDQLLLPVETCVSTLPKLQIPPTKLTYLIHGNDVAINDVELDFSDNPAQQNICERAQPLLVALYYQRYFLGVGKWHANVQRVYPKRLLADLAL